MAEQKQQKLQIELKQEVATGNYSNMSFVANTKNEFVLDFVSMLPGLQKALVSSRIIMAPEHAKRLLFALNECVKNYEKQFGTIELQQPEQGGNNNNGRTIAPFGRGGEA